MKCGGAMKKYAKGGSNVKMGIYGIPQENVGTSSQYMPTAKKGGVAKAKFGAAVAVKASCKKGMVRAADGRCVMERAKFAKGGFPDLNKDGKITRADILKGRGVIKKMGGSTKKK